MLFLYNKEFLTSSSCDIAKAKTITAMLNISECERIEVHIKQSQQHFYVSSVIVVLLAKKKQQ